MATPAPVNQHNQMRARIARAIDVARTSIDANDVRKFSGNISFSGRPYIPTAAAVDALIIAFREDKMSFTLRFDDEKETVSSDGQLTHLLRAVAIDFDTGEEQIISTFKLNPVEFGGGHTHETDAKRIANMGLNALRAYTFAQRPLIMSILGISVDEAVNPSTPTPTTQPQPITESKPAATDLPPLPPVSENPTFAELRGFAAGFKVKNYAMPPQEYLDFLSKLEEEANQECVSEKDFIFIIMNIIEEKAKQMGKAELPHIRDIIHRIYPRIIPRIKE